MSKWLSSVNNLLEKLDDTAEAVAEERRATEESTDPGAIDAGVDIDDILARRGLALEAPRDQEDTIEGTDSDLILVGDTLTEETEENQQINNGHVEVKPLANTDHAQQGNMQQQEAPLLESSDEADGKPKITKESEPNDGVPRTSKSEEKDNEPNAPPTPRPAVVDKPVAPPSTAPPLASTYRLEKSHKEKELVLEAKEAQKESRTLRRHVVSLNSQLEAAESELQAQRKELEHAAEQMEKDRQRSKEAKENAKKSHKQELIALRAQNEEAMKDQKNRFEDQLEAYRKKLAETENQRRQEDGNWSKEMTHIVEKEQEMSTRLMLLEYV